MVEGVVGEVRGGAESGDAGAVVRMYDEGLADNAARSRSGVHFEAAGCGRTT